MRPTNSILSLPVRGHTATSRVVGNVFAKTLAATGETKQGTQVVADKTRSGAIARLGAIADDEGGDSDDGLDIVIDPENESSVLSRQKVGGHRYDGSVVVPNPIKLHANINEVPAKSFGINSSTNNTATNTATNVNNNAKRTSTLGQVGSEKHVTLTNTQLEHQQESLRKQLAEQHQSNRYPSSVSTNKSTSNNIGVSTVGRNFRMIGTVLQDVSELMKNATKMQENRAQRKAAAASSSSELQKKRARDEEIDALLAKKSTHESEAENAIFDRFNKECDKYAALEKKAIAQSEIKSIKIKAFYCEDCKLLTEKAIDLCRTKGHRQVAKNTVKKFFECKKCYRREFTLGDAMFPKKRCQMCNSYEWVSCGIKGSTAVDGRADVGIVSAFSEWTSKKERRRIGEMVSRLD